MIVGGAARGRRLQFVMLLLSVCAAALIARRAQPEPSTAGQGTADSLTAFSETARRFSDALLDNVGSQAREMASQQAVLEIAEQAERAAESSSITVKTKSETLPGVWPRAYDKRVQGDRPFSVWGVSLYLRKEDLVSLFPGSTLRTNPFRHDDVSGIDGDVISKRVSGTYDPSGLIRALSGDGLESAGEPLVDVGDSGALVQQRLGLPCSASYEYFGMRHQTEWTYEFESFFVHVHFDQGVVARVCLWDKTFEFGHIRC